MHARSLQNNANSNSQSIVSPKPKNKDHENCMVQNWQSPEMRESQVIVVKRSLVRTRVRWRMEANRAVLLYPDSQHYSVCPRETSHEYKSIHWNTVCNGTEITYKSTSRGVLELPLLHSSYEAVKEWGRRLYPHGNVSKIRYWTEF